MVTPPCIIQVAVPAPLARSFDYLPPDHGPVPHAGARVRVPFGRKIMIGVVLGTVDASDLPLTRLKRVAEVIDAAPLLPAATLKLLQWVADYYHHPIGEVLAAALPVALRQGRAAHVPGETVWSLTDAGRAAAPASLARAPAQARVLAVLRDGDQVSSAALVRLTPRARAALKALAGKGFVAAEVRDCLAAPAPVPASPPPFALNSAQAAAVAAIVAAEDFAPFLLHGITGSGKTEVYLRAIASVVAHGRQALVLVPEIALTPQLVARFQGRFAVPIAVLHSGLTDPERLCAWLAARSEKAPIVLGTRSAVFAPMPNLGLIVVDEEHDGSYKQQDGLRYSARDVAVMRARQENVPVVLGSATPALESLHNVKPGGYRRLDLPQRTGSAALPAVQLLDMRRLAMAEGLSHPLRMAIGERLAQGEQSLLFLNRRGFAPVWMCHDCGWLAPCTRCDARLTLHQAGACLRCHHCGAEHGIPRQCGGCQGNNLHALGEGTQRIEAELARLYPSARVVRIDRDSTRAKGALEEGLRRVHAGEADILVGTQMLSKGHDFPNVTLVGVLNADQGLYSVDFRAPERLFQQVLQVSGRAGRAAKPGAVLIQTHHPEHPVFAALAHHDYEAFARYTLAERHAAGLPPFAYLALLRAESPQPGAGMGFLQYARAAAQGCGNGAVEVTEPLPSPMERRAGRYRAQLLVQSNQRPSLHGFLRDWLARLAVSKEARKVRWSLDVDPLDMY